jgi:hypothetical protein
MRIAQFRKTMLTFPQAQILHGLTKLNDNIVSPNNRKPPKMILNRAEEIFQHSVVEINTATIT